MGSRPLNVRKLNRYFKFCQGVNQFLPKLSAKSRAYSAKGMAQSGGREAQRA